MAAGDKVVDIVREAPAETAPVPGVFVGGTTNNEQLPCWEFNATDTRAVDFICALDGYDGGGLRIKLKWQAPANTSGAVRWEAAIRRIADDAEDLDSGHTYVFTAVDATAPSAAGEVDYAEIVLTDGANMDSLADGELFVLRLQRNGGHANDTMAGDANLFVASVLEAT